MLPSFCFEYPNVFPHLVALIKTIKQHTTVPISISCQTPERRKYTAISGSRRGQNRHSHRRGNRKARAIWFCAYSVRRHFFEIIAWAGRPYKTYLWALWTPLCMRTGPFNLRHSQIICSAMSLSPISLPINLLFPLPIVLSTL